MGTLYLVVFVVAIAGLVSAVAGLGVVRLFRAVEEAEQEPFGGRE